MQSTKLATKKDRAGQDIDGIQRPTMLFVGQAKGKGVYAMLFVGQAKGKGVYGRYHSVHSNFATLKHFTEDNATISDYVGRLYPSYSYI